jgi:UDP-N-acetylmuramyl tripeptide synthase
MASAIRAACRVSRVGGGTSLPGLLVQRLDPGFVSRRSRSLSAGITLVSGTNGKTTTAAMVSAIQARTGHGLVTNDSGANLFRGVASILLAAPDSGSMGVFEVDEAALERLIPSLRPTVLVLTNVFRDQLDRFGEPETVANLLREAAERLPDGARVVANADDPLLSHAVEHLAPVTFGVRGLSLRSASHIDSEPELCPRCGGHLAYSARTMAHLGAARCERCRWGSSQPDVLVETVSRPRLASMSLRTARRTFTLQLGGVHNAYNAAAAVAAASALGTSVEESVRALEEFRPAFGRTEELWFKDRRLWLLLAKNPAGTSATVAQVLAEADVRTVVIMVSDRSADGRDVSWIWDADVESMVDRGIRVVAGGTRAAEVAIRIKYAGGEVIAVEPDAARALSAGTADTSPEEAICVLATYTAMLEVRRAVLESRVARVRGVVA